jgi:hypothetical protein
MASLVAAVSIFVMVSQGHEGRWLLIENLPPLLIAVAFIANFIYILRCLSG